MTADGRFAPSPTGPLHLGSLRTALVAWLMARSQGGRFLLRIEDLDPQRSRREFEAEQQADLQLMGIEWDEEPMRQSDRGPIYEEAVAGLNALERLYPCFCTRAEIREAASAPHGELPEGFYPGTCSRLPGAVAARRIEAGERYAIRVRAQGERIGFVDELLGPQSFVVDDFVVVRADGVHAYQLAVVIDDAAQGIDQVVRGADLADSTPRQILLQRLLGLPTPRYAHVPLVLGPGGERLAKRDRAATLADRDEPPAVTLALLAHSLGLAPECDEVRSASELVAEFDSSRIPRVPITLE